MAHLRTHEILTPIAPGELLDKLTILELKLDHIQDPKKLANIRHEHGTLSAVARRSLVHDDELDRCIAELKSVNGELWSVEDALRGHEARQSFGADFVNLARSVYGLNDRRAAIKKRINLLLGSDLVEEKSYGDGGNV